MVKVSYLYHCKDKVHHLAWSNPLASGGRLYRKMVKNGKTILFIVGLIVVMMFMQNNKIVPEEKEIKKESSGVNIPIKSLSLCNDRKEFYEGLYPCVGDCFKLTQNYIKCNDYWARINGYTDGWGFNDGNRDSLLNNYAVAYNNEACPLYFQSSPSGFGWKAWIRVMDECSQGILLAPQYPKCVSDSDCSGNEMCDLSTQHCIQEDVCLNARCPDNTGWYCEGLESNDKVHRTYSCVGGQIGGTCDFIEDGRQPCEDGCYMGKCFTGDCNTLADIDCDGMITWSELDNYITGWATGDLVVTWSQLDDSITSWALQ